MIAKVERDRRDGPAIMIIVAAYVVLTLGLIGLTFIMSEREIEQQHERRQNERIENCERTR